MNSPYEGLEARAYWRTGVSDRHCLKPGDLYRKKFAIGPKDKIATAGSCFAQHIARRLRLNGYDVLDVEPPPPGLTGAAAESFGYTLYSARHGNIYTVRQLLQLTQECLGERTPADIVWEKNGRFFDALRPSVEPGGLPSPEAVHAHRQQHLANFKALLHNTNVFIFTMGLTETWRNRADGTVYPTAPGTVAGTFDPERHEFVNLNYNDVVKDFLAFRLLLRKISPNARFLLTVSPVPLTATASVEHVLPATTYSKSVLRAAAGYLSQTFKDIDYFPSYEIIATPPSRGAFYENNLRTIAAGGVDVVMETFFSEHQRMKPRADPAPAPLPVAPPPDVPTKAPREDRIWCDEELLEAFAR